jgi:hypothetical protein
MAMITMDASIVAIVMLSVVLDRAIHLYLSGRCWVAASVISRTLIQSTPHQLLDHNYLLQGSGGIFSLMAGLTGQIAAADHILGSCAAMLAGSGSETAVTGFPVAR